VRRVMAMKNIKFVIVDLISGKQLVEKRIKNEADMLFVELLKKYPDRKLHMKTVKTA
jgi:hypothetical protein